MLGCSLVLHLLLRLRCVLLLLRLRLRLRCVLLVLRCILLLRLLQLLGCVLLLLLLLLLLWLLLVRVRLVRGSGRNPARLWLGLQGQELSREGRLIRNISETWQLSVHQIDS